MHIQLAIAALAGAGTVFSSPLVATKVAEAEVEPRAASSTTSQITNSAQLSSAMQQWSTDAAALSAGATALEAIFNAIVPAPGPTGFAQAQQELQTIFSANPQNLFNSGAAILENGLAGGDYADIAEGYLTESNENNMNLMNPNPPVYPMAGSNDAPYSVSEADLRKAIYIPPGFTYGKMIPVLFFPGTAEVAGQNFAPNFGKLFVQNKIADPVYVNIPNMNLGDIQVAAEYAAYAVNYISAISNHKNVSLDLVSCSINANAEKVTILSWSAGSIDGQWAFKYWPSTRNVVSDAIRISPDFHGTVLARLLCPGFQTGSCTPGIDQQYYNSTFIETLRNNGGDSAYVPTTNVYSIFDEIVQPQEDPNASGFIKDARGVGVTNVELQSVCTAVLPGGTFYNSHEGVLYNALAYALAVDAIQNPGPGSLSRVNATLQCQKFAADGLSLADIFATEALIPIAVVNIAAYPNKSATEPPIMPYAQKDTPATS